MQGTSREPRSPLSFREGAEQALAQGHRRTRSSSDEPENAVDETASVGTREFCQDLETPSPVLSFAVQAPCTREFPAEFHTDPERASEAELRFSKH